MALLRRKWAKMWQAGGGLRVLNLFRWRRTGRDEKTESRSPDAPDEDRRAGQQDRRKKVRREEDSTDNLIAQLMDEGRYALLLRPQVIDNLNEEQFTATVSLLEEQMALVPPGEVLLDWQDGGLDDVRSEEDVANETPVRKVTVASVFIDRYPVTNRQYQEFVDAGGYDQMALWDEEVWPAVLDFVDETDHPGPRYWKDGHFLNGMAKHPVVGVSWYEAAAYARWSGKRLPSDAEWVKAGSWPIALAPGSVRQRRYPWGNSFENDRANLWGTGLGETVGVDEFADGVSVGGVYQMIGNVWEWTSGGYGDPDDTTLVLGAPMKSIRGGAFDTYFENQATCHSQSGEDRINRKHNIGFRLALAACDLAPAAAQLALTGVTPQNELAMA